MRNLSLQGVRVVDFSWVMAGPMATKMLGAMGAEIIKIESSERPEFSQRDGMFSVINRNKRSCTLNFTSTEGQELLRKLVAESDIVVENFSGGVLKKFGLSYDDLRQVKPDLIFVSASGLGRTGPQRDALAYGSLLQGYSGRVSMIGQINPALEAMGILPAWTDPITALWEVLAILAAWRHRAQTGEGTYIDLSMLESTVALLPGALLAAALEQPSAANGSGGEAGAAPSGCFRCAGNDEWLAVSVRTDSEWRALCTAMRRPDLLEIKEFADSSRRVEAKAVLDEHVAAWLRGRSSTETEHLLHEHGIPAARSRDIGELIADQHLKERDVFRHVGDELEMSPLPWLANGGWRGRSWPTRTIGADNAYVFGELLGLSPGRQRELADAGVIR
jgi:crotonobetainyl-CoA:carnitine CoA-transferase CaiB-like acyl-CoA transferase